MFRKDVSRKICGFTLVELLVVIAIIGVLVALLLPAVQAAREAARRLQCLVSMKNVTLGMHNYHDANEAFPPAYLAHTAWGWPGTSRVAPYTKNWAIMILPYLEQSALADSFTFTDSTGHVDISDERNRKARSTRLPVMLCPSDPNTDTACSRGNGDWARGNLGVNMIATTRLWDNSDWDDEQGQGPARGISFVNQGLSIGQITDGTTNTIMLGELRAGIIASDPRGTWAMSQCASSAICNFSMHFTSGPNDCNPSATDVIIQAAELIDEAGAETLIAECMMPWPGGQWAYKGIVRSLHPGGANVTMADGSARFISDFIDNGPKQGADMSKGEYLPYYQDSGKFRTWQRLSISNDAYVVDGAF